MPKENNMFTISESILTLNSDQIAYPIGPDKDSYTIYTWFILDIDTEQVTHHCEVRKNTSREDKSLFTGTYKECYQYIEEIVSSYT